MTVPFRIGPNDRVTIYGRRMRALSHDKHGCVLEDLRSPGKSERLSYQDLTELLSSPEFRLERNYFTASQRAVEEDHPNLEILKCISPSEQRNALWRLACCEALKTLQNQSSVSLTYESILAKGDKLRIDAEKRIGRMFLEKHAQACQPIGLPKFPNPSSLLRWYKKYRSSEGRIEVLISRNYKSGNKNSRFCPEETELMANAINHHCSTDRKKMSESIKLTQADFIRENSKRAERDEPPLRVPSDSTVRRIIKSVSPFRSAVMRHGKDKAVRDFALQEKGLGALFPLERVEMDENKLDVISLAAMAGMLEKLPKSRRAEIEKLRRILYLAKDCATKCILAVRIAKTPNSGDAVRTLRDVVRDKSHISRAFGCQSPWSEYGRPFTLASDFGSAFYSEHFECACASLGIGLEHAPAGKPFLRGNVEAAFGVLNNKLLSHLPGRTFHNVIARGDNPSEALASLSDDELVASIVTLVVDIYHNTPHEALNGETPRNAWANFAQQGQVPIPPDAHEIRAALGHKFTRRLSKAGVTFQCISYSCAEIRDAFLHNPEQDVVIRVDYEDLGWISVQIGKSTFAAQAKWDCFIGMSLAEWRAVRGDIHRRRAHHRQQNEQTILAAYDRIDSTTRAAMLRQEITPFCFDDDDVERSEENLRLSLREDDDSDPNASLADLISPPQRSSDPLERGKVILPVPKLTKEKNRETPTKKWRFDDE